MPSQYNRDMKNVFNKNLSRSFLCMGIFALSLVACSNAAPDKVYTDYTPGDKNETLASVKLDEENAFFDDFNNGVDYDRWQIGAGAWGYGNGGVIPENVFYTEDGNLILRGNGLYYAKNEVKGLGALKDGRNTGAAIISKFAVGPGHYEVKMKPLTRLGACTAFWTFTNRKSLQYDENDNHEIDIELPGGKSRSQISFKNVLNTNYITESMNISKDLVVADMTSGETINLADGKFHTFGFDWYTDPSVVIYFCDGHITAISDLFVPTLQSKLWLGNWFPNNAAFVGESLFETDYMVVDWVKYVPFLDQPFEKWDANVSVNAAERNQYPTSPIILENPNMIANGDFDALAALEDKNNRGWVFSKLNGYDEVPVEDICYIDNKLGLDATPAMVIKEGGYASTVVDAVYEDQPYNLSFFAKTNASDARVILRYRDVTQTVLESKVINVSGDTFKEYKETLLPPEGTYAVQLQIYFNDEADCHFILDEFSLLRGF